LAGFRRKKRFFRALLFVFLFLSGGVAVGLSPLFDITSVEVVGSLSLDEDMIISVSGLSVGENVFLEPLLERSRSRILEDRRIEDVSIHRRLPGGIRIIIEEKRPRYLLLSERLYGVTADGELLPLARNCTLPDVPLITGIEGIDRSWCYRKITSSPFRLACSIISELRRASLIKDVSEVNVSDTTRPFFFLISMRCPVYLDPADIEDGVERISAVMEEIRRETDIKCIDARFDNQLIVRYKDKPGKEGVL